MAKITLADGMVIEGTIEEFKQMGVNFPVEEEAQVEPLKVWDYVKIIDDKTIHGKQRDMNLGEIRVIRKIDTDKFPIYAEKLDGSGYDFFREDALIRATDEEVDEAMRKLAEKEKWAKIGRKPYEFKKGDIVRVDDPCGAQLKSGDLVEVKFEAYAKCSVSVTDRGWMVTVDELITPVEARFDEVGFDR